MLASRPRVAAFTAACVALAASSARAQDPVDQPQPGDDAARHRIDRTWLYADDARVAAPMTAIALSSASYTDVGSSVSRIASPYPTTYRAFAANTAQPGFVLALGGEVGLLPRLSVMALGQMGVGGVEGVPNPSAGALVGLRAQLEPSSWRSVHVVLSGGYVREAWSGPVHDDQQDRWLPGAPNGDGGAWVQAALSVDVQRLRLATTLHGEHIFWNGRDPLDVMAVVGASYRVVDVLRLGVEYVGQDLEESIGAGAEGGVRHFFGPVAAVQLLGERLSIVAGPAVGLSPPSPEVVGRLGVSYGF